jgi:excisionase family DNA binding protein
VLEENTAMRDPTKRTYGQVLRGARAAAKLSDADICERAGLEPLRLAEIESDASKPTPQERLRLLWVIDEASPPSTDPGVPRYPPELIVQAFQQLLDDVANDALLDALWKDAARRRRRWAQRQRISSATAVEDLPEYLTVHEVCAFLRASKNTVYDAVRTGQLPSRRLVGSKILIPRSALLDHVQEDALRGRVTEPAPVAVRS